MSGPIEGYESSAGERVLDVEVRQGRDAEVGGLDIIRVLPTKGRRTVGPWCFVDLMLPADALDPDPMEIGPHPHIGLATVTWLFRGAAEHSDSLGTKQLIRPGELNLMSSGHGIAHAEQGLSNDLMGAQMWVAQPDETRHGGSAFEHHDDLPRLEIGTANATVILGSLSGVVSPARTDSGTLGADLALGRGTVELPVAVEHEHVVVPIDRSLLVGDVVIEPGWIGLIPAGRESVRIDVQAASARALLLGGEPLGERIQMWWNFVARTRDEITAAWQDWQQGDTDRFGPVPTSLERLDAPAPPWIEGSG